MNQPRAALFLDRDGVINARKKGGYIQTWAEFRWEDGVLEALQLLKKHFYKTFIVTNQQGIGKGLMSEADLHLIHNQMRAQIEAAGGHISEIFFCPDLEKMEPICRKPNIGMGLEAKRRHPEIELENSVMVGDSSSDMEFGRRLGMRTIFITTSHPSPPDGQPVSGSFGRLLDWARTLESA